MKKIVSVSFNVQVMRSLNLQNCGAMRDLLPKFNITSISNVTFNSYEDADTYQTANAIIIKQIVILLILYVLSLNKFTKEKINIKTNNKCIIISKGFSRFITMLILLFVMPITAMFLFSGIIYKSLCYVIIKRWDKYFVSYLDSFDVFWCLEGDCRNNIINVLGIVQTKCPRLLALDIKNKLETIMFNEETEAKKIFYRRNEKFGFYYWRRFNTVDLDQYIKILYDPKNYSLQKNYLEDLMVSLTERPLPYEDEGLFEILITENKLANGKEKGNEEFGIIFRIHHSVGDGVALVEFLSKALADGTSVRSVKTFETRTDFDKNFHSIEGIMNTIRRLYQMLLCFVDSIIRVPDKNLLHGPKLSGKKLYKWTNSDENLYIKIKEIKNNLDGVKFSHVLANALSYGLQKFFKMKMETVPEEVAVIFPVKISKSHKLDGLRLRNNFSVTIMDLPIKCCDIDIVRMRSSCNKIQDDVDPMTNYYLLKVLCSILPKGILQKVLNSNQATLVFSNMPGPEHLSVCGGNELKSLIFFVPYKGSTGVGITCLTYGNELRFGIVADEILLPTVQDLECIIGGMVEGINELHRKHVK